MSSRIKEMLADSDKSEPLARAWPVIKEILTEQQLITSAEDKGHKKLKGFAVAYRVLEQFQIAGEESINQSSKQKNAETN